MAATAPAESSSNAEGYVSQLLEEQGRIPVQAMPHTARLLQQEIDHTWRREGETDPDGTKPSQLTPVLEIHTGKPLRLKVKVHIPVKDHPNFNFIGKLLGPKGNSLKQLQEITQTKMAILGRGSMKDKQKEEELRTQDDPKYYHLREDLHVEITAFAPPAEAYQRIATALAEVKRFLVPDYFDDIRQQQLRELGVIGGSKSKQKTPDHSNQESPVTESEDTSPLMETGTPTVPYLSNSKRQCMSYQQTYTQTRYSNNVDDYRDHSITDSPFKTYPRRFLPPQPCNGICNSSDAPSNIYENMYDNSTVNMYGSNYIHKENTTSGNAAYVDEIDITHTFDDINDEQCVPPRRFFPIPPASRNPSLLRSVKFRNHPYGLQARYQ